MLARTQAARSKLLASNPAEKEIGPGGLHEQITEHCRAKGWPFVHSRTDQKTTCALGTPDFIIAGKNGATYWVECKRAGSKPTTQQLGMILMLQSLGHKAAIVYSYQNFLDLVAT